MNASIFRLLICSPNSHLDASPVSMFQNCFTDSFDRCFLVKNLYLSRVRFLGFTNVCSQFSFISLNVAFATTMYGNFSGRFFFPADPEIGKVYLCFFSEPLVHLGCLVTLFARVVVPPVSLLILGLRLNISRLPPSQTSPTISFLLRMTFRHIPITWQSRQCGRTGCCHLSRPSLFHIAAPC